MEHHKGIPEQNDLAPFTALDALPVESDVQIICFSERVRAIAQEAVRILSGPQQLFSFHLVVGVADVGTADAGPFYSWRLLAEKLSRERQRLGTGYLFGVLDEPIEHNWFSRTVHQERLCFITTHGWEFLTHLPVTAFVAIEIVENLVEMLLGEQWAHEDTRGCLHDLCSSKPDISYKLRTGDICPTCNDVLRGRLNSAQHAAVVAMLEEIRRVALHRTTVGTPTRTTTLAEKVDREFPFPIAYCFRSMQAELTYSRKWQRLLELYAVIVRYLTFTLLADLTARDGNSLSLGPCGISGLRNPTGGAWHKACFAMMRFAKPAAEGAFLSRYLGSVDEASIAQAEVVSLRLNELRNETTGHGWMEEEPSYRDRYEASASDIEVMLGFVAPLADYPLVKPTALDRRGGISTFSGKVLMGSHPLFPIQQHRTAEAVDTDCLLHDPREGKYLSLHPWLVLDACPACHREVVFLYDKIDGNAVLIREYPGNHSQRRAGLLDEVQMKLAARA